MQKISPSSQRGNQRSPTNNSKKPIARNGSLGINFKSTENQSKGKKLVLKPGTSPKMNTMNPLKSMTSATSKI